MKNLGFDLVKQLTVLGASPNSQDVDYTRAESIARVSRPSDKFYFIFGWVFVLAGALGGSKSLTGRTKERKF